MQTPAPVHETLPWPALGASEMTESVSPSGSVSLPSTFRPLAVSSSVDRESSLATGGWLTWLTVTETVAVSVPPLPSEIA